MNPEESKNTGDLTKPRNTLGNSISSALFYLAILFFIIGFNFSDVMVGNWYQQFMPNLGGRNIVDITFTDSLNGYAITNSLTLQDTSFILKTSDRGDSWYYSYSDSGVNYTCIQFINQNTGFVGGRINKSNIFRFSKTTNAGLNWYYINAPFDNLTKDIFALNQDTIWIADDATAFGGGVFFTSNGGANWVQQLNVGGSNPDRIYMYNARIGFVSRFQNNCCLYKTTNSGLNWISIPGESAFNEMYFIDSLTGWKSPPMKKTTNGGLIWINQVLPQGGNLVPNGNAFSVLNKDTLWASGGYKFFPGQGPRGTLNFTTNGGDTWYFQLLDTSYQIPNILYVDFVNKRNGWAYLGPQGVHTTNGGDTTFYLPIQQISTEIPNDYKLFQNYPNPFNPNTNITYNIKSQSSVKIIVFNIQGKQITELINEKQTAGTYELNWDASAFSSGVYFYSLIIDDITTSTKKMIFLK